MRPAGLDFREGDVGLPAGRRLSARDIGLVAAMNRPWLLVYRQPRIAILPTGDEVVMPTFTFVASFASGTPIAFDNVPTWM